MFQNGNDVEQKIFTERLVLAKDAKEIHEITQAEVGGDRYAVFYTDLSWTSRFGTTCLYVGLSRPIFSKNVAFILKKNSPYKPLFEYL